MHALTSPDHCSPCTRTSRNGLFKAFLLPIAALAVPAMPLPLLAQRQSCPAGAPIQDPSVNVLLLPTFDSAR